MDFLLFSLSTGWSKIMGQKIYFLLFSLSTGWSEIMGQKIDFLLLCLSTGWSEILMQKNGFFTLQLGYRMVRNHGAKNGSFSLKLGYRMVRNLEAKNGFFTPQQGFKMVRNPGLRMPHRRPVGLQDRAPSQTHLRPVRRQKFCASLWGTIFTTHYPKILLGGTNLQCNSSKLLQFGLVRTNLKGTARYFG